MRIFICGKKKYPLRVYVIMIYVVAAMALFTYINNSILDVGNESYSNLTLEVTFIFTSLQVIVSPSCPECRSSQASLNASKAT